MKKITVIALLLLINSPSFAKDVSFGAGFGIPYGLLGANMDYIVNDTLDITFGAGLGFGAGIKYHPLTTLKEFRITTFYGTNATLTNSATDESETFNGLNIGIGYGSLNSGWDIDLIVIINSDIDDEIDKLQAQSIAIEDYNDNEIKISFGYHW